MLYTVSLVERVYYEIIVEAPSKAAARHKVRAAIAVGDTHDLCEVDCSNLRIYGCKKHPAN